MIPSRGGGGKRQRRRPAAGAAGGGGGGGRRQGRRAEAALCSSPVALYLSSLNFFCAVPNGGIYRRETVPRYLGTYRGGFQIGASTSEMAVLGHIRPRFSTVSTLQCVLVIRESFTKEYGSRVFHSSPCGPLFLHIEPNQLSLVTRTHCISTVSVQCVLVTRDS